MEGVQSTWDGKTQGNKEATEGTYFLILKAVGYNGKVYEKQTYITLVR
jgi:hypothetical protein